MAKKIDRQIIFNKYSGRCAYCGTPMKLADMQVDHCISQRNFQHQLTNNWRIPQHLTHLTMSDVNHIDNLMPACRSCNNYKSANHLEAFRNAIEQQVRIIRAGQPMIRLAERYGLVQFTPQPIVFHFESLKTDQS